MGDREQSMPSTIPPTSTRAQNAELDGRAELADPAAIGGSHFANPELLPVPLAERTWTTYNYLALWVGMSHNLASYALAASLIAVGMNAWQVLMTIAVGNVIVLIRCCSTAMREPNTASRSRCSPGPSTACAAPTCPRCCGRWSPAAGSASRPGSAARAFTSSSVLVVFIALLAWILIKIGGLGPLVSQPARLGWAGSG